MMVMGMMRLVMAGLFLMSWTTTLGIATSATTSSFVEAQVRTKPGQIKGQQVLRRQSERQAQSSTSSASPSAPLSATTVPTVAPRVRGGVQQQQIYGQSASIPKEGLKSKGARPRPKGMANSQTFASSSSNGTTSSTANTAIHGVLGGSTKAVANPAAPKHSNNIYQEASAATTSSDSSQENVMKEPRAGGGFNWGPGKQDSSAAPSAAPSIMEALSATSPSSNSSSTSSNHSTFSNHTFDSPYGPVKPNYNDTFITNKWSIPLIAFEYTVPSLASPGQIEYLILAKVTSDMFASLFKNSFPDVYDRVDMQEFTILAPYLIKYKVDVYFYNASVTPIAYDLQTAVQTGLSAGATFNEMYLHNLQSLPSSNIFSGTAAVQLYNDAFLLINAQTNAVQPSTNQSDSSNDQGLQKSVFRVVMPLLLVVLSVAVCLATYRWGRKQNALISKNLFPFRKKTNGDDSTNLQPSDRDEEHLHNSHGGHVRATLSSMLRSSSSRQEKAPMVMRTRSYDEQSYDRLVAELEKVMDDLDHMQEDDDYQAAAAAPEDDSAFGPYVAAGVAGYEEGIVSGLSSNYEDELSEADELLEQIEKANQRLAGNHQNDAPEWVTNKNLRPVGKDKVDSHDEVQGSETFTTLSTADSTNEPHEQADPHRNQPSLPPTHSIKAAWVTKRVLRPASERTVHSFVPVKSVFSGDEKEMVIGRRETRSLNSFSRLQGSIQSEAPTRVNKRDLRPVATRSPVISPVTSPVTTSENMSQDDQVSPQGPARFDSGGETNEPATSDVSSFEEKSGPSKLVINEEEKKEDCFYSVEREEGDKHPVWFSKKMLRPTQPKAPVAMDDSSTEMSYLSTPARDVELSSVTLGAEQVDTTSSKEQGVSGEEADLSIIADTLPALSQAAPGTKNAVVALKKASWMATLMAREAPDALRPWKSHLAKKAAVSGEGAADEDPSEIESSVEATTRSAEVTRIVVNDATDTSLANQASERQERESSQVFKFDQPKGADSFHPWKLHLARVTGGSDAAVEVKSPPSEHCHEEASVEPEQASLNRITSEMESSAPRKEESYLPETEQSNNEHDVKTAEPTDKPSWMLKKSPLVELSAKEDERSEAAPSAPVSAPEWMQRFRQMGFQKVD